MKRVHAWRDSSYLDGKMSAWTLRFGSSETEKAFVASRADDVVWNFRVAAGFTGVALVIRTMQVSRDWMSSGGIFDNSEASDPLALVYNALMAVPMFVVLVSLLVSCRMVRRQMGFFGFELFCVFAVTSVCLVLVLLHPWHIAGMLGVKDKEAVNLGRRVADLRTMLYLDVILSGTHLLLPARWLVLLLIEVAPALCYAFFVLAVRGYPMDVMDGVMFAILTICASLGRRQIEFHERAAFAIAIDEKTRRIEVEHRLDKVEQKLIQRRSSRDDDAASNLASVVTADVFRGCERVEERSARAQFQELAELGYREHWLIPSSDLVASHESILGTGGFGIVMRARYHGAVVVLKAARGFGDVCVRRGFAELAQELRIYRRLHHPNIVLFFGACVLPRNAELVLVLEHVNGTSLSSYIRPPPTDPALSDRLVIANGVACALAYLHAQSPQIVHGDIKDSNVHLEMHGARINAKVLDFGLSRLVVKHEKPCGGTFRWMAPEVFLHNQIAAPSADTFSFGCLLYFIMSGSRPFADMTHACFVSAARLGQQLSLPWGEHLPKWRPLQRLSQSCLRSEPDQRPGMATVQASLEGLLHEATAFPATTGIEDALDMARAALQGQADINGVQLSGVCNTPLSSSPPAFSSSSHPDPSVAVSNFLRGTTGTDSNVDGVPPSSERPAVSAASFRKALSDCIGSDLAPHTKNVTALLSL